MNTHDPAAVTLDALVDMNHPAVQDILSEVVFHPSQNLRIQAASRSADLFQDARALPGLAEALDTTDKSLARRATSAIWDISDADYVGLVRVIAGSHTAVRDRILAALDQIGWQPDSAGDEAAFLVAARRWRDCVALGGDAVRPLLAVLRDYDGAVRRGAAWALGEIGDARAVRGLSRLLTDSEGGLLGLSERVCDVAAEALARIGTEEAQAALVAHGFHYP